MSSPTELREASKHLKYEIQMLFYLRDYLQFSIVDRALDDRQDHGLPARNAIIESFGTHLRNLVHFFYDDGQKSGDLESKDYVPDAQAYWKGRPKRPQRLSDRTMQRVSREIAHLTLHRSSSPAEKTWQYVATCDELVPVVENFLEHVDPARVEPNFEPIVNQVISDPPRQDRDLGSDEPIMPEEPIGSIRFERLNATSSLVSGPSDTTVFQNNRGSATTGMQPGEAGKLGAWVPPVDPSSAKEASGHGSDEPVDPDHPPA